ncbi:MAG: 5-deoxy-glucuronate isomerase [Streptococcaceae bacterium]|jgi:5-deoxy-glucuronate isomerase|nr:5-deoxy-glucuronate isomerase [Streptococcaceae bacterium]
MVELKRSPIQFEITEKVTLLHHITRANSPLEYIEAQVFKMEAGGSFQTNLEDLELCIVALTGKYSISDGQEKFEEVGVRESVFEKRPTDSVYIPVGKKVTICCAKAGSVILCYSPANDKTRQTTLIKAADNTVEQRGKYNNKRLVHNILDDQSKISEKLLVVEVYTDQANWSSYPPHKHDVDNLPQESFLEETYYHEMNPQNGFVFQRVYTDDRLLDETMTVYNEEMVIVPRGYHPVSVAEGYDGYYLNIMAGPNKIWKFHNDKGHEWIINRD